MTSATDRLVGDVLDGRYEIIDRAGRGGMATVYKAKDRRLDRIVAVKVMREDWEDDPDYARRFDAEARAVANLSDAHIVSVFDQGSDRGRPYIVMEFVEGTNLKALLVRQGALPPARAIRLLEAIAGGLAAAHAAGIVHRDVKPENVLLSPSGDVKVTDFGLARQSEAATMTVADGVLGTLTYVSPERLLHQAPVDFRSDIYSTGVLAFEMLTGRKPFTGDTPEIVSQHLNMDVPAPSSVLGPGVVPPWLDALVVACGRRDPADRPRDGHDLLKRIRLGMTAQAQGRADDPSVVAAMSTRSGDTGPITVRTAPPPPSPTPTALPPVTPEETPPLSARTAPAERVPSTRQAIYRRRRIFVAVLAAIVLTVSSVGVWWLASGRFTTMPDIVKHTQADATALVVNAGLKLEISTDFSETVPVGAVMSSDPVAGAKVPRGNTVSAVVSKGPERYEVPKLAGLSLDEAESALTSNHLKLGKVTSDYSESVPEGTIIKASLAAGAKVKRDTAVDLLVSQGPRPIPVVDYRGKPAQEAVDRLTAAGLVPVTQMAYDNNVPEGAVISQTPHDGTLKKGDTVTLVVSQGPRMVVIPLGLVGGNSEDAKNKLKALGLVPSFHFIGSQTHPQNIVTAITPDPGTSVRVGTIVTLYIR